MTYQLSLKRIEKLSPEIYGFYFLSQNKKIDFKAGQFLQVIFPHKNTDIRGDKRYFTIASSPLDKELLIVTKIIKESSSFKKNLLNLKIGDSVAAEGPYGEFVLPNKKSDIFLMAGGIGVTPYISMIKHLLKEKRELHITLFYAANKREDIVFRDLLLSASKNINIKITYFIKEVNSDLLDENEKKGYISKDTIRENISDIKNSFFYVSGPKIMIDNVIDILKEMKIDEEKIKKDYFVGYNKL